MRTGVELTRSQKEKEQREESKADESPPPDAHPKELERRPVLALVVPRRLLRAGASIDNCRGTGAAEWCIYIAESGGGMNPHVGVLLNQHDDWIAMKSIVAGVRREGSWKAYCRVEHKRLLRLRSYLVRGYAETTDARVDRILRLPNGACWTVLAYWREAA